MSSRLGPAGVDQACKSPAVKPWSTALAGASKQAPLSLSTQRRYIENFRSVLSAINQKFGLAFPALSQHWAASHAVFSERVCELQRALAVQTLTRELSPAEQARWVNWPRIRDAVMVKLGTTDFESCPVRELRDCVLLGFYVLIPPCRNDLGSLRFVGEEQPPSGTNYVQCLEDNTLVYTLGRYKSDGRGRASSTCFDPTRVRRYKLDATNASLRRAGFRPKLLADMLRSLRARTGPTAYLFDSAAVSDEAMRKRTGKVFSKLPGVTAEVGSQPVALNSQMLRKICCTWLADNCAPSIDDRSTIAEWMQHSVQMQLNVYTKSTRRGTYRVDPPAPPSPRDINGGKRQRTE